MMGQARTNHRRSDEDRDFDRRARAQSEARVINVSPYVARWQIATQPGSEPRFYKLEPGESVHLQFGYTVEGRGAGREPVRPTIEALTEREAWAGERVEGDDNKFVWITKPGPRLPMVCSMARAEELPDGRPGFAQQWREALGKRAKDKKAPLKMTLRRSDGGQVDVEAEIDAEPGEDEGRGDGRPEDVEDLEAGAHDEPPPAHDDPIGSDGGGEPLEAVELPRATAEIPPRARRGPAGKTDKDSK